MKKPETLLKENVFADLKKIPLCFAEKIQQVCKNGTLDIAITINSFAVWIELKKDDHEKPSSIQTLKGFRHEQAGAFVFYVTPSNWKKEILPKLYVLSNFKHLSKPDLTEMPVPSTGKKCKK